MGKKVVLRDYQQDLFSQLIKMPKTNVMVQLEAGAGKTYIELYLAEYLVKHGYKVAICTPWTLIRDQIQEKSWLDPKQVEITSAQILLNQGDLQVTLIVYCLQRGIDYQKCLADAYKVIKNREGKMVNGTFVKESDLEAEQ